MIFGVSQEQAMYSGSKSRLFCLQCFASLQKCIILDGNLLVCICTLVFFMLCRKGWNQKFSLMIQVRLIWFKNN